ncbi:PadR family transcriptional regulator [Acetobacterium tundrae]|uniref:PadR family transcriptional regulator n=1 Tax=Acetobacterium tundrae TaxID=132932 RepID=A0ABR6WJU1_9FIRM|nr:PadR family transcriptional regulator [Acetobacterium tundrae]MBC3796696.1 PadR family transcriptional regulator [Acetobacterium tundrae]
MSTVDLMLLGVLIQKPMNAYEMKKEMEFRNINNWVKISSPSVYKNLVKLYKSEYINGETVREGEMPEKTIYTINEKGRNYFMQLMHQYSENPGTVYVDFCAFIANLHYMDYETGLKMIAMLQDSLAYKCDNVNVQLERMEGVSFYATSIITLYSQMYTVFYNWLEDFKKQYKSNNKNS